MSCFSDSAVARLVAGSVDLEELARADAHLDVCAACRERVAARARRTEASQHSQPSTRAGVEPAHLPPDPLLGRIVGDRYQVIRKLGSGGMGTVYEAEHVLIGRRVALKVLHAQWAQSRDVVRRFQNEARAAGTLGHPGILQALDMGRTEEGLPFLALELLEGRDLDAELVARGPFPIEEAARVAIKIADALGAAHAAGIVHRDLKPENVFLTRDGDVKVLDFGISKIASSLVTGPATAPGSVMGTPAYMAPEQLEDAVRATPRSDVYALGVILYRLLTSELPFRADSLPALLLAIVTKEPAPIRTRRRDVPDELAAIVRRAMSPSPEERFASMEAVAEALAPYARAGEAAGRAASASPRARRIAAVLVVHGVDEERVRQVVEQAGGRLVSAPPDAGTSVVGVFGERSWLGDEAARAVEAGLTLRPEAESVAVATGHLVTDGAGARGEAIERALEACHARLAGVAVVRPTSAVENAFAVRAITTELAEVRGHAAKGWSILPSQITEAQPLLGREAEVAAIRAALERAREGTASAVAITGGAGMGKTRLAAELVRLAEESQPSLVIAGRADPRGGPRSLLASALAARARWGARMRGWPRIDSDAPIEERRAAVTALVREAVPESRVASVSEFLGELLGAPMPTSSELAAARATPRLMSDRLSVALAEYLDGVTARGSVVLVLEDLQWADPESLALVEQLVRDVARDRPLLVAGTARPELVEALPPPFDDPDVVDVRLRGLGPADVQTLAAWITGEEIDEDLARALVDRTGGNPFFLEQILRTSPDAEAALPIDIEAAVQARLDALPDQERAVLRTASVLAVPFTAAELEALGVPEAVEHLASLARSGLVRRRSPGQGAVSWEVRTPLTAEVVYGLLDDEARTELHRKSAAILGRRGEVDPELVARHFDRGDVAREAARFYHRAALEAVRQQDTSKMLRCADRALTLGAPEEAGFSIQMIRAEALEVEGRLEEQGAALARAATLASTPEEEAIAATAEAVRTLRVVSPAASLPAFERAIEAAQRSGDPLLLARALGRHATALAYLGRTDEAAGMLAEMDLLVSTSAPGARAESASFRAQLAGVQGDLGARRAAYMASVALYGELGDARNQAGASVNLADVHNRFGAYADADAALTAALAQCRRLRMVLMSGYALANRGYARTQLGRFEEAAADLERAIAIGNDARDGRLALFGVLYRARLRLAQGDARGALADAASVASVAPAHGLEPAAVLAHVVCARAALATGDVSGALDAIRAATDARSGLGALEEDEADLFAAHADVLDAAGRAAEAAEVRAEALRRLTATANRIADRHLRQRFLEDVPAHRSLAHI